MNTRPSSRGTSANLRRDRTPWPPLLTTLGRAVAFSTCLPSDSNQHNLEGSSLLDLPIKRDVCCACVPPQLGGSIPECLAFFLAPWRIITPASLICGPCSGRQALRFLAHCTFADATKEQTFPDPLGLLYPFFPSLPCRDARLRAERISGFTSAFPAILPSNDQPSCEPFPPGCDLQPANPLPGDKPTNRSGRLHTTKTSRPPQSGQTGGCRSACPYLPPSFGPYASKPERQPSLPTPRIDRSLGRNFGRIHSLLAVSKRQAYQKKNPILTVAFNRAEASWHPASSDLINQVRIPDVIQDSDFRTKIALRKNSVFPPSLRASGALQEILQLRNIFSSVPQIFNPLRALWHTPRNPQLYSSMWTALLKRNRVSPLCTKHWVSKPRRQLLKRSFSQCRSKTRSTHKFFTGWKPNSTAFLNTSMTSYEGSNDLRPQDHVAK